MYISLYIHVYLCRFLYITKMNKIYKIIFSNANSYKFVSVLN